MIDFDKCIVEANVDERKAKFKKVALIHKYWSRKPFHLIEDCILKYSKKNSIVLDPFCGSGSSGIGAILNGRYFIGYDLNPTAIFITDCTLDLNYDEELFNDEIVQLTSKIKDSLMSLYKESENRYLLYSIVGKNDKNYNAVTCNYDFKNKQKLSISQELLHKKYPVPDDLDFPNKEFPKKFYKDRFSYKGVSFVSDMYTSRNLSAVVQLYDCINKSSFTYKNLFWLAFSNTVLHVSKLKAENVRPLSVNNYWIPDDNIEENVLWRFLDRINNIKEAKKQILNKAHSKKTSQYKLFNKSSIDLGDISDESIDYVITDPPYGDVIQYSELSFIWNNWLNFEYDNKDEVIINPVLNKGLEQFQNQIGEFIKNTARVLKRNGYFTLCFQNKDVKIWLDIIKSIKNNGFSLEEIKIYDTFGSPYNKHWAKFSPKADLYVTFKKDEPRIIPSGLLSPENVIDDIIGKYDSSKLDMNRIYDFFVAEVIYEIFNGKEVTDMKDWTLKKIIKIYEAKSRTDESGNTKNISQ